MDTLDDIQPYSSNTSGDENLGSYQIEPYNNGSEINSEYNYDDYSGGSTGRKTPPMFLIIMGLTLLGLILLGIILFTSGGGNGNNNDDGNTTGNTTNGNTDPNRNVVLQWWGVFLSNDTVQPLIDEYESLNPNVTIEYADQWPNESYEIAADSYQTELNRVLNANDPVELPDIFMVHNTWTGDYESYVQPSTVYDFATFSNIFYPAIVNDFAFTGSVLGTPMWFDTLAIAYNKELLNTVNLDEPPTDWLRFKNAAEALTIKNGNTIEQSGFASGLSTNVSYAFELINLLMFQNGVSIVDEEGLPNFSSDTSTVEAFDFFNIFEEGSDATWNSTLKNDAAEFLEEDLAMTVVTSYRLRELLRLNDQFGLDIDIRVSQIPQIEGQDQEIINWADYWGNMVTRNRPYSAEAWAFLAWLSEPEQQTKLHNNIKSNEGYFGHLYPRSDMNNDLIDDQYLSVFNDSAEFAKTWYMIKGLDIRGEFKEILNDSSISSSDLGRLETNIRQLIVQKGILN